MWRLLEAGLFLAPFAAYALWRHSLARDQAPSRRQLALILAALAVLGAGLAWFGTHERLPAGTHYVPARLNGGRIVPGHGE